MLAYTFSESDWLTVVVGVAALLIGWGLSYFFFVRGKRDKVPAFTILHSTNYFNGATTQGTGIQVFLDGVQAQQATITVTDITFWNAGRDTIKKGDVIKEKPLTIMAKGDNRILDTKCVPSPNSEYCHIVDTKSRERTNTKVAFDYLGHNQGATLKVVHTGLDQTSLDISGELIGGIPWIERRSPFIPDSILRRYNLMAYILIALSIVCLAPLLAFHNFDAYPGVQATPENIARREELVNHIAGMRKYVAKAQGAIPAYESKVDHVTTLMAKLPPKPDNPDYVRMLELARRLNDVQVDHVDAEKQLAKLLHEHIERLSAELDQEWLVYDLLLKSNQAIVAAYRIVSIILAGFLLVVGVMSLHRLWSYFRRRRLPPWSIRTN